jgi:hypothetical protein
VAGMIMGEEDACEDLEVMLKDKAEIRKQRHIKEIQNAATEWEREQLIEEERIRSLEKAYRELLYFYNENTSRKYS